MKKILFLALAATTVAAGAHAQSMEDRLRAQLVAVTAQLHDLQARQAAPPAPSADEAKRKARLAAAQAEIRTLRGRPTPDQAKADTAPLQAQIATLTQARAADQAALASERQALAQANEALAQLQAADQQMKAVQAADTRSLEMCRAKNVQALQVARYLLKAYRQVSVADVLARDEPVAGIARARIEQIEQTYADQIYQSRLDASPPVTPAPASPPKP
jgi:hypothetical protein